MITKGDNLEYYALLVLEKYTGLKIDNIKKREFPDWEVNGQGIEITRAVLSRNEEFASWFNKHKGKSKKEIEKINKKQNAFLFFVNDKLKGGSSGGTTNTNIYVSICKQAFLGKIKKLNTNYKLFDINALFIFTETFVDDEKIGDIFDYILSKSTEYEHKFDYVYIYTYEKIYIINLFLNTIESMNINEEDLTGFSKTYKKYLKEKKCENAKEI